MAVSYCTVAASLVCWYWEWYHWISISFQHILKVCVSCKLLFVNDWNWFLVCCNQSMYCKLLTTIYDYTLSLRYVSCSYGICSLLFAGKCHICWWWLSLANWSLFWYMFFASLACSLSRETQIDAVRPGLLVVDLPYEIWPCCMAMLEHQRISPRVGNLELVTASSQSIAVWFSNRRIFTTNRNQRSMFWRVNPCES